MNDDSTHTQTAPKTYSEIEKNHAYKIATGAVAAVRKALGAENGPCEYKIWTDSLAVALALNLVSPTAIKQIQLSVSHEMNHTRFVDAALQYPGVVIYTTDQETWKEVAATCDRVFKAVVLAILP